MKILKFVLDNILFFITLFLLAFIPLYPKLPLWDVSHTWVYIRLEDFVITFVVLLWIILMLFRQVTLKTPLTLPIIIFWIIAGISVLHGVTLIFPTISDVFPNVAFLSMLRRIEYISLFFIAYASMKDKQFISYVVIALALVLLLVVGYGFGQKFYGLPAYLTMNEEFAKGIPIQLSQLSRIPSTFAGHYDLAAYLVLIIPILTSMVFGFRNWLVKIFLLVCGFLGFTLLFMTVSRVSFFVLLTSLVMLLILQKKKLLIMSLFLITLVFLSFSPSLLQRFGNTIKEIDVLVDPKTGGAIGHVKEVPAKYFENKLVIRQPLANSDSRLASSSAILPFSLIPSYAALVIEPNSSTGENLPQGTGYVNLPLSPVSKRIGQFFYQESKHQEGTESAQIRVFYGDFIIKRAKAFDLSYTTRFQGQWPRTITAFKRNIFLGSGYSSVTLAVDNNYLRILGESGLFGFVSFLSIFLIAGIFIKKILPKVDSHIVRSFVLGFIAGTFGLALNAVLIDVFEASKVAFTYWLLMGVTIGALQLYKTGEIDLFSEFKKVVTSTPAIIIYLLIATLALFFSVSNYYFVGDDFTWFRWVQDCCNSVVRYFTEANGFFYRPGTKVYFSLMYSGFWFNQAVYHMVSILLHFSVAALIFLISKRVLRDYFLSAISAVLFLILSGHHEAIFWISSTGFLFNAMFALMSLLFFIYWKEKGRIIYLIISFISIILSLLFHELGVMVPFLIILYDVVFGEKLVINRLFKKVDYLVLLFPILPYLVLRYFAESHWFSGDYSYNLFKLPYNFVGNTIGYLALALFGPNSMPFYQGLRSFTTEHAVFAIFALILIIFLIIVAYQLIIKKMVSQERRIIIFASLFFILSLLPFLGLGNITSRYSYLSSLSIILFFVFFLKKTYSYLLINGKYIAIASVTAITIVFVITQMFQLQKIHTDWQVAGETSKRVLVSLSEIYKEEWRNKPMQFYFVDVPIRFGEAWVFPVGLPDAVWLLFGNKNIDIYQLRSLKEAIGAVEDPRTEKVFEFDEQGGVVERKKLHTSGVI